MLVGDPDQLASVEAGAVLGDVARAGGPAEPALDAALGQLGLPGGVRNGVVTLEHVWRFGGAIADLARAVQAGDADTAVGLLAGGHDDLDFVAPGVVEPVRRDVVAAGAALALAGRGGDVPAALAALEAHRVLCAHRRGPYGVARWTADIERWLPDPAGREERWYPGRPVLVTANDYDTGLYNGDIGVVVSRPEGPRVAFARGGPPTAYPPSRLSDVVTVHAMTVHRGQGSQFRRVTVVLPPAESPLLTRELLYTAVTRAREHVRVVGSAAAVRAAVAAAGRPGERPAAPAGGLTGGRPGAGRTIRGGPGRRKAPDRSGSSVIAGSVPERPHLAACAPNWRSPVAGDRRRHAGPDPGRRVEASERAVRAGSPSIPTGADLAWLDRGRWRRVAIIHGELEHTGAAGWAGSFRRRPELGAAVFEVSPGTLGRVLDWAYRMPIPRASRRSVHVPSVDAWAVLDGGVVHVYGCGLTTLPAGVRIVGLQAFRLVLAELGFVVPPGLTEASSIRPDALRGWLRTIPPDHPSGLEQADLLASCTDAVLLRWVASTLLAEYGTTGYGSSSR